MRLFNLLAAGCSLLALSCNNNASTTEEHHADTASAVTITGNDTPPQPPYDAATDGMLTAGAMAKKLSDTLGVKMYELTLKPGDSAALHKHPDHAVYVLQGGKAAIYFDGTNRQEWELKTGMALVNGPVTDAAKNIGKTTIRMLIVDMYRPRAK